MTQPTSPRLERPLANRKISGVCAAIARNQRIDVNIVRATTLILMAAGGIGFVAYFVGLLLIPAEGSPEPLVRDGIDGPERNKVIILGVAAVVSLFGFGAGPFGLFDIFDGHAWPFVSILALIGGAIVLMRRGDSDSPGSPTAVTTVTAPPSPGEEPTAVAPITGSTPEVARRWGRNLMVLGGALLALAAAGSILAASGDGVRWDIALCAGAIAIGATLVLASPFGGARILAPIGVVLALFAGTAAAADLDLRGGVGDHLVHPVTLGVSGNSYHLAAGRLMVDLKDAELAPGRLTTVHAEVGFGQLVVRVPRGVVIQVSGHASAGDVEMFGRDSNGLDAKRSEIVDGNGSAATLAIDAHTGFGQVRVISAGHRLPPLGDHATITTGDSR